MPDIYISHPDEEEKKTEEKEEKEKTSFPQSKPLARFLARIGARPASNPLAAFLALPEKVKFETQEKKEEIILLLRRHWVTNLAWIFLALLMIFAPLSLKTLPLLESLPPRFRLVAVVMWYLFILGFVFEKFLSWFFNVFIITDERIIDVDFYSLVYREICQAKIDKIQDITYKSGGLLKAIFDYGDVYIQTAGEIQQLEFESIPQPVKVVKILNQLIMEEEQEKINGRVR